MIISEKYEVTGELGQGGMGTVYRVRHVELDTVYALKVMPKELCQDPQMVERFRREARVMARLSHRNIVRVFDFTRDGDVYYLIMEYLEGKNLRQHLQESLDLTQRPLPLREVLRIGAQIARALAFAHAQTPAVVHRDIKPSNIIMEAGTGRAVVTDFGIATILGDVDSKLTRTGLFVGTVKYCSPEQMRHDPNLDGRCDIYSLGLVLYDLYTGEHLFSGLTDQEVVGRALYGEDADLSAIASAEPAFARIVERAIRLDPDARYPTADVLLADLRACLQALEPAADAAAAEPEDEIGTAPEDVAPRPSPSSQSGVVRQSHQDAGPSTSSWFSPADALTQMSSAGSTSAGTAPADFGTGAQSIARRRTVGDRLSRRVTTATQWLAARWWALALLAPAAAIAVICVVDDLAWIGRPFPGFFVMENAVVPTVGAYHWTGMRAGLPGHSTITAIDGQPLAEANDVYTHAEQVPPGTPVTYTLDHGGRTFDLAIPTMTFGPSDYAPTVGLLGLNGVVILLMGAAVGLLSPQNRPARVFLLMSILMGLFPLAGDSLYRSHRFTALHWFLQCVTPAAFIHLALVFPVERRIVGPARALIALPYVFGAFLTFLLLRGFWAQPVDLTPLYAAWVFTAVGLLILIGGTLLAYVQHRRAVVRGRVQVVMIGVVAAFLLPILGFLNNVFGGGFPLNLTALTPILFFLAVAYAIVKHRLFDVQLIVRKSVVFGMLLAAFTGLYVAVVSLLNAFLAGSELPHSPEFTGAFMAVSLATAFPLRDRLNSAIERRLFPHKHRFHETVREISRAITGMTDLRAVLDEVMRALVSGMGIASGAVLLRDEAGKEFREAVAVGTVPSGYTIGADSPLVRLLSSTQCELFADDLQEDPELAAIKEASVPVFAALQAELLIPLFSETGMIGILALGRTHGGDTLTSEDLEVLRSLAAGVGLAVARSLDAARTERMALHRQVLERHLPATSVRNVLARDPGPPGTHRARVTTLYLRLRGFNAFADRVGPDVTVALLREYYEICDAVIHKHGGTTERYDGARVVAIFGDPVATADHAACAVRAALAVRHAIEARRAAWHQQGYDLLFGIGVASGFANVGFVGSGNRGSYAALGTTVDVAERLCDLATAGDILAPRLTVADVGAEIQVSDAGEHPIAGLAAPLAIARIEAAAPP